MSSLCLVTDILNFVCSFDFFGSKCFFLLPNLYKASLRPVLTKIYVVHLYLLLGVCLFFFSFTRFSEMLAVALH